MTAPFYIVDRDNDFYRIGSTGLPSMNTFEHDWENRAYAKEFKTRDDAMETLRHWHSQMDFKGRVVDADEARRISGEGAQLSGVESGVLAEIRGAIVAYSAFAKAERNNDDDNIRVWGRRLKELRHVYDAVGMKVSGAIELYELVKSNK